MLELIVKVVFYDGVLLNEVDFATIRKNAAL